jgi:hypothetical protein
MKHYFIYDKNKESGPYLLKDLENMKLNSTTLIRISNKKKWKKLADIKHLQNLIKNEKSTLTKNQNYISFFEYLKKKYLFIIVLCIVSIIICKIIDDNIFNYMVVNNYGGFDGYQFKTNNSLVRSEIKEKEYLLKTFVMFFGLFTFPIIYLFKNGKNE